MARKSDVNATDSIGEESCPSDTEGGYKIGEVYIPPPPPTIKKFKTKGQPRIHIHSIEITNFKSYAGTQILGPFCKSFNAIIGPNGSGKSNVIDAMLFVFGSKSSRIRCSKIDQLVHKSEAARNMESCTVSVQFVEIVDHGDNDFTTVPNSEFRITRTVYKNHNDALSFYFIDEKQVQFKTVTKCLKKHGVDLVNQRFLILQGQVEAISQMPYKGRTPQEQGLLEYLEEIIGTNRYNTPLAQLRLRIDHNEKEKELRMERVKSVRASVEALAGDLEKCITYFKKENVVRALEYQQAQGKMVRLQDVANATLKKKQEVEKLVEKRQERFQEVSVSVTEKQGDIRTVEAGLKIVESVMLELNDNISQNRNLITQFEASTKENQKKLARYKKELIKEQEGEQRARALPATAQVQIEKLEAEILHLEEKKKEEEKQLVAIVATIADATRDAKEKKDALQGQQIELRRKFNEAKSEYDLAHSELSVYTSTEIQLKSKLDKLKASLEETTCRYNESKKRLVELELRLPQLEAQHKARSAELQRLIQREIQGNSDLHKYQTEAADIKDRMETSSSSNQLIDFVMKLKMSGSVSGILGRLGDLGAIDEKYDVAVSTACGALDYIVVETVEAGQAVLSEVKRANKGRVNVMALNQMGHMMDKRYQPGTLVGGLTRLFDLIRVEDERVKPAMYFATGSTLVSESLEAAMRVSYAKQVRVVTLEGVIIDPSGTMSGGGRTLIRGKMGRSVTVCTDPESTVQSLKKISRKMDNLEKELANLRSSKSTLEMTVAQLRADRINSQQELQKLNIDIPSLESNIPSLQNQILVVDSELERVICDPKQVKKLSEDVKKKKAVMEKCEEQAKKLEEKVAKVHEEIIKISAAKTGASEKLLNEAIRSLLKAKSDLNNLNVEVKRADRDVLKCSERAKNLKDEIEGLGRMQLDNSEHIQIYNDNINVYKEELNVKQNELATYRAGMDKILKEMSKLVAWRDKEETLLENACRELRTIKHTYEDNVAQVRAASENLDKNPITPVPVLYDLDDIMARANTFEESPDVCEELTLLTPDEARAVDIEALDAQITKLDNELRFLDFNESRVVEYKQKIRDYVKRCKEMQAVLASLNTYSAGYEQCLTKRQKEFDTNFAKIARRVKECYQMLTFGGEADLEYEEYSDPYAKGIKYVVRPLRKSWKSIDCLSGGEKTLASLALVFALHYYSPSPLYFLDEIDAALDTPNVAIIGQFIRTRTRFAQFIIVSLRHEMFQLATNLIGIYKTLNCTKSITITKDICKDSTMSEEDELLLNIEISDDDDEEDDEEMTDNSQQGVETEEDTTQLQGERMLVADTEDDEAMTVDEGMDVDNDGRSKQKNRRGRRKQELVTRQDLVEESDSDTASRQSGHRRRSTASEKGERRLRVRGVKQINAGTSAIQSFIKKGPVTSTPKTKIFTSTPKNRKRRQSCEGGNPRTIADTSDEDIDPASPQRKRRSVPHRQIIPNTENEESDHMDENNGNTDRQKRKRTLKKSGQLEEASQDEMSENVEQTKVPIKKRRGRKRKDDDKVGDLSQAEYSQDEDEVQVPVKKRRGRPKKKKTGNVDEAHNQYETGYKSHDEEEYSQDERDYSQDESDVSQDEGGYNKDEKPVKKKRGKPKKNKDENVDNVRNQYENGYISQDEGGFSQDEGDVSQDEGDFSQYEGETQRPVKKRGRPKKKKTGNAHEVSKQYERGYNSQDEEYSQDEGEYSQDEGEALRLVKKRGRPKKKNIGNVGEVHKQYEKGYNSQDEEDYSQDDGEYSQNEDQKPVKKRRSRPKKKEGVNTDKVCIQYEKGYNSQDEGEYSQDEEMSQDEGDYSQDEAQRPVKKRRGRPQKRK